MKLDKHTLFKAYLTIMRKLSIKKDVKIQNGPLKGYKWNLASLNNYFFIGTHEEDQIDYLLDNLEAKDTFYDIGANAGYFSIAAATKIKDDNKIFAFEPLPRFVEIINHHKKVNNMNNIKVFPLALSNKEGEIEFSDAPRTSGNTYIQDSDIFKNTDNIIKVKMIPLDTVFEQTKGITPPKIMKIDCEGAEYDVLQGAEKVIEKYKPIILLSTHDRHLPGVKDDCLNFLSKLGYEFEEQDLGDKKPGLDDFIAICKN